jgi:hypothetical protein
MHTLKRNVGKYFHPTGFPNFKQISSFMGQSKNFMSKENSCITKVFSKDYSKLNDPFEKTFENSFENSFENFQNSENFAVLTAAPGSGKTYTLLQESLKLAKKGYCSVVCFPTKALVDANFKTLQKMKCENLEYQEVTIDIHTITNTLDSSIITAHFATGKSVILTVHAHYSMQGDFFKLSPIFYLSKIFAQNIYLFVDEAHDFLKNFQKNIPLTYGYVKKERKEYKPILKSTQIQKNVDRVNYEVTPPLLFKEEARTMQFYTSASILYDGKEPSSIWDCSEFDSLIRSHYLIFKKNLEKLQLEQRKKQELVDVLRLFNCHSTAERVCKAFAPQGGEQFLF